MRKIRRISSKIGEIISGTDFTYEDIKKEGKISIDEYEFSMEGKDVVDGKMVVKITTVCKTETIAEEVGHSKVIMWIDPEINIVRKSLFFDINGNRLKTIYVSDIRKVDGKWTSIYYELKTTKLVIRVFFDLMRLTTKAIFLIEFFSKVV